LPPPPVQIFQTVLVDVGERGCVIRFRHGQRPAVRFVLINPVFDALAGQDEAPVHRQPTVARGDQDGEGRRVRLGRRWHARNFGGREIKGQESIVGRLEKFFTWSAPAALIKFTRRKMSEENPFTRPATSSQRGPNQPKPGWIVAGILAGLCIVALLLWATALAKVRGLESLRSKLDDANAGLASALIENQKDKNQIAALQTQVADLAKEKEMAGQMSKSLEDEMRAGLESKDVTISKLQGKLTVNILDRVLFDSGEAILKPDGESVMRKIGAILAQHPELKIHVIGHTDNVPMRARFASNWELSTARALAAVHFLTEKAAVDPHRVGAVGYGEYRPIADNATAEGRARNRRIAITILPDELAAADVVPAVKPSSTTDSPSPSVAPEATETPEPPVK